MATGNEDMNVATKIEDTCPHCGAIWARPVEEVHLTPNQRKIYEFVARRPGVTITEIHEHLYYHRDDGGPTTTTINTTITNMNKILRKIGQRVSADHPGPGAAYRLRHVKDSPE